MGIWSSLCNRASDRCHSRIEALRQRGRAALRGVCTVLNPGFPALVSRKPQEHGILMQCQTMDILSRAQGKTAMVCPNSWLAAQNSRLEVPFCVLLRQEMRYGPFVGVSLPYLGVIHRELNQTEIEFFFLAMPPLERDGHFQFCPGYFPLFGIDSMGIYLYSWWLPAKPLSLLAFQCLVVVSIYAKS